MQKLEIIKADLENNTHSNAILELTNSYAKDPMGLDRPLKEEVINKLIPELKKFPCSFHFIAFMDGEPAGIANCVFSFSTFYASKVINIHDLTVNPAYRSKGIGEALIGAVEKEALAQDCCKVTLEVREDNRARNLYERSGFLYGEPRMFFMEKKLK
ncbi:MAG: GNAT family N-acetyltransferase [Balneolaceae bacterium]